MTATQKPKTMIDFFCGIGLGAAGFVRAGFTIAAAVDLDPSACALYKENFGVKPLEGDIREISGNMILAAAGLNRGEAALCVGCPPCQGFSSLRRTTRVKWQHDRRKSLLSVFADRVGEILPKTVVLENVSGLTKGPNRRYLMEFIARMRSLRYECAFDVLDARNYGVPQRRKRLILIGAFKVKPVLPVATHADSSKPGGKVPWVTVRQAIGELPSLESGKKDPRDQIHAASDHGDEVLKIIRNIPANGGSRSDLPKKLWLQCHRKLSDRGSSGAGSVYGRLRWDAPSGTVTTKATIPACGRFVHPSQHRGLTLREVARLQSVDDWFKLKGHREQLGTWLGNGMPPRLAEEVGRQVMNYV